MRTKKKVKFVSLGIAFGSAFPVIAIISDLLWHDLPFNAGGLAQLFANGPLHWIILSAPAVLGIVFHYFEKIVGERERKILAERDANNQRMERIESFILTIDDEQRNNENDEKDTSALFAALIALKERLLKQREEDEKAKWVNGGLAMFGEILRSTNDLKKLSDDVIKNLVKYLELNQGAVYVVEQGEDNINLSLIACYAYERKKYGTKKFNAGEGLIGQCYLEQETIVLKKVPQDYIRITSGLGEAAPQYVVLVPIKNNDGVQGVVELAGFSALPDYRVAFIEKVCEGFASVLLSVKNSEATLALLDESKKQAAQLQAQEEEMRQNMEELQATQEELERKSREAAKRIELLQNENAMLKTR